ncbi:MAG: hypothetical protein FJY98_02770 [Candidatus Liptonbacteria bacterium]|nr:hypothetical protein [Candidatus Liptonbacteria bacterium]
MTTKFRGILILLGALAIFFASQSGLFAQTNPSGLTREELERQIQAHSKELETLQPKLESARQELQSTRNEKRSLQQELASIDRNISQLNLSIRSDELTAQKLAYEIDSLEIDLKDIRASFGDKQAAIAQILNEIQRLDGKGENLLAMFLRNASLADGVLEAQSLTNLQAQLTVDVENLRTLHEEYDKKLTEANKKRANALFHQNSLKNKKLIVQDQRSERESILKVTKSKETVYQKELTELEKEQERIADEIEALNSVLRTKIDPSTLPPVKGGILAFPVNVGRNFITQGYGSTGFAKTTYRGKWHNGIDIGSPVGTPIVAAEEGKVVAVGNQDNYCPRAAYGKFIVVKHTNNLVTLYAHLSRQAVVKGQRVERGEVIGYMGRTGWATGPHLHFVVFAAPTYYLGMTKSCGPMPLGGDLNPMGYL